MVLGVEGGYKNVLRLPAYNSDSGPKDNPSESGSRSISSIVGPATLGHFFSATGKGTEDEETKGIIRGASHSIYMLPVLSKLKKIESASNDQSEDKKIARDIRTVLTSNFHDFHSPKQIESSVGLIQQSFETDNTGNLPHIIRGGWKGHAVYFVVQKGADNKFKITICNRGEGIINNHKVQNNRSAPKEIEIKSEKLGEALHIIADACSKDADQGIELIYTKLISLVHKGASSTSSAKEYQIAKKYQKVGICDIVNLKQALAVVCKLLYEEAGSKFYSKYLGRKALEKIDIDLGAMLQSSDSTEQKYAVMALNSLISKDEILNQILHSNNLDSILQGLGGALKAESDDTKKYAERAVANILKDLGGALKDGTDDTKKDAACAVANLAVNEAIREQIATSSNCRDSVLEGLGGVLNDAEATDDTKEYAACAVANLALNDDILGLIAASDYLGSILECLDEAMKSGSNVNKENATRAHEAIRKKIVQSGKLGGISIRLFMCGYARVVPRLLIDKLSHFRKQIGTKRLAKVF